MKQIIIAPSLLAADFTNLSRDIDMINASEADWLHIDVMDGMFVPNISFGQNIVKQVGRICKKPMDVHLMIEQPERYIEEFRDAGAEIITVHYEASRHIHRLIDQIKATGAKAGVAINPHTPSEVLLDIIEMLDLVLVMSVNPGFGGQKFIYQSIPKVRRLREMIDVHNCKAIIEVDGGVGLQNAEAILSAGAQALVAGNSVFTSNDPIQTISQLKALNLNTYLN
jgi:ribulose-phosphate 3-epimerase